MRRHTFAHSRRSDLWFPQYEKACVLSYHFIVGQIGSSPNATADIYPFMSMRFVVSTNETADLFIDPLIVGQIGVPPNATADIHTFMSIRFVVSTK